MSPDSIFWSINRSVLNLSYNLFSLLNDDIVIKLALIFGMFRRWMLILYVKIAWKNHLCLSASDVAYFAKRILTFIRGDSKKSDTGNWGALFSADIILCVSIKAGWNLWATWLGNRFDRIKVICLSLFFLNKSLFYKYIKTTSHEILINVNIKCLKHGISFCLFCLLV